MDRHTRVATGDPSCAARQRPAAFILALSLAACSAAQTPTPYQAPMRPSIEADASGVPGHCSYRAEYQYAVDVDGMEEVRVECDLPYKEIARQQATMWGTSGGGLTMGWAAIHAGLFRGRHER
jgi:hypothetical protein